jgi:hypothetical protein
MFCVGRRRKIWALSARRTGAGSNDFIISHFGKTFRV